MKNIFQAIAIQSLLQIQTGVFASPVSKETLSAKWSLNTTFGTQELIGSAISGNFRFVDNSYNPHQHNFVLQFEKETTGIATFTSYDHGVPQQQYRMFINRGTSRVEVEDLGVEMNETLHAYKRLSITRSDLNKTELFFTYPSGNSDRATDQFLVCGTQPQGPGIKNYQFDVFAGGPPSAVCKSVRLTAQKE